MPFEQYLELAQWAAEQMLATQDLPPPPQLASRLRESRLDPDLWYSAVDHFKDWFHRLVGSAPNLAGILARSRAPVVSWRPPLPRCLYLTTPQLLPTTVCLLA